ncbi:MAG: hypothetical protein PVJ67_02865 [Candidatus Pacearchaeota archaeon]|jgi:hypothetical protein
MKKVEKINNNTLAVIIGLVISIGWIFMGLDIGFQFVAPDQISYILTLAGQRHTIMTLLALVLIPICARENRWGLLSAMILGIVTLTLSLAHIIYMLIATPSGFESQIFGPTIWSIIQIPIIFFGYKAQQALR